MFQHVLGKDRVQRIAGKIRCPIVGPTNIECAHVGCEPIVAGKPARAYDDSYGLAVNAAFLNGRPDLCGRRQSAHFMPDKPNAVLHGARKNLGCNGPIIDIRHVTSPWESLSTWSGPRCASSLL